MSNSSPIPVPIAVIIAWISLFERTLLMRFFSLLMIFPRSGRIGLVGAVAAGLRRAAGGVALDDVELGRLGIAHRAVGELARQGRAVERRLAPRQLARLPRREPCAHRRDRLVADRARVLRVLLEERARSSELTVVWTRPSMPGLPSFVFVCPSNCGFWSLTETTAASPSRTSSPSRLSPLLEELELLRLRVQRAGQARCGSRRGASRPRPC